MADIELVIKVPEEDYLTFSELSEKEKVNELSYAERIIANGTPLPKGHEELIERNKLEFLKALHDAKYGKISWGKAIKRIKYSAPTIIKADTTESEERNDNN